MTEREETTGVVGSGIEKAETLDTGLMTGRNAIVNAV